MSEKHFCDKDCFSICEKQTNERIEKLQAENAALCVLAEGLKKLDLPWHHRAFCNQYGKPENQCDCGWDKVIAALSRAATPHQALAEVKAKGLMEAADAYAHLCPGAITVREVYDWLKNRAVLIEREGKK